MKTGALLVREGLIRRDEIENALSIQAVEKRRGQVSLGRTLVKKGLISKAQILELAQHPLVLEGAGKRALETGLVTEEQFQRAEAASHGGKPIGECLTGQGALGVEALKELVLQILDSRELAGYLTALSLVSPEELREILDQFGYARSIGGILCEMNLVAPAELFRRLSGHGKLMKLGEILMELYGIHGREIDIALKIQKSATAMPLGRILINNNVITEEQLNFALSRQCNLPFEDLAGFSFSEAEKAELASMVSREFASEGGIIPVKLERAVLTMAVSVPGCLLSMGRFTEENPFLRVRTILTGEGKFQELYSALYGGGSRITTRGIAKVLVDLESGRVARGRNRANASSEAVVLEGGFPRKKGDLPGKTDAPLLQCDGPGDDAPDESLVEEAFSAGGHPLILDADADADEAALFFHPGAAYGEHGVFEPDPPADLPQEEGVVDVPVKLVAITRDEYEQIAGISGDEIGQPARVPGGELDQVAGILGDEPVQVAGIPGDEPVQEVGIPEGEPVQVAGIPGDEPVQVAGIPESGPVEAAGIPENGPVEVAEIPDERLVVGVGCEVDETVLRAPMEPPSGSRELMDDGPGREASVSGPVDRKKTVMEKTDSGYKVGSRAPTTDNVVFLPVMEMEITDPEKEGLLIERMYRGYEGLKGGEARPAELSIFKDFIKENHRRICDTFSCSTVTFNIESYGDRVMIQAVPGRGV